MESTTLVLQLLNEKLNKQEEKIDSLVSMMKEFDINMQVLVKYISSLDEVSNEVSNGPHVHHQQREHKAYELPVQKNKKTNDLFNLSSTMSFPDEIGEELGPQGDSWTGGFGGLSNFNPIAEVNQPPQGPQVDYNKRPEKELEEGKNIIYVYENKSGVDIDQEDLDRTLETIEKDQDKFSFKKTLSNITNGIKTIYSSRDPDLYYENITILDNSVEIRYNKVTPSSNNTNYNKLFS